jgi:dCMP deaminase
MKRARTMMRFALDLMEQSKCEKRHVAAVITDEAMSQVLSIGLNGGPKGLVDCMCVIDTKYGCMHAEVNALIKCSSEARNKVMFTTLVPCNQCAASIINAPGSFSTVYYNESWKEDAGIRMLKAAGINVVKI